MLGLFVIAHMLPENLLWQHRARAIKLRIDEFCQPVDGEGEQLLGSRIPLRVVYVEVSAYPPPVIEPHAVLRSSSTDEIFVVFEPSVVARRIGRRPLPVDLIVGYASKNACVIIIFVLKNNNYNK